jgi:hypothetical protein
MCGINEWTTTSSAPSSDRLEEITENRDATRLTIDRRGMGKDRPTQRNWPPLRFRLLSRAPR